MTKAVVLIHGFMNSGVSMRYMDKHLRKLGYSVYIYAYSSRNYSKHTLSELHALISKLTEDEIYLIGHSMGGLVIRNYLYSFRNEIGRIKAVVTIGTPHNQSKCASNLASSIFRVAFGTAGESGLTSEAPEWHSEVQLGCIAGVSKNRWSTNWFIWRERTDAPSDGTIFVQEAILDGCTDSILLEGAHTGLLFNKSVINQCHYFIQHEKFKK